MKKAGTLFLLFLLSVYGLASSALGEGKKDATFSSFKGQVKVFTPKGHSRKAVLGHVIHPGDTIQVGSDSQASVSLPDGSSLDLSANSRLTITSLTQPSPETKNFLFQLAIGKLFAQVRKLITAKSSFEVEAGGVVCGVRGTQFSMNFDPDTKKLDLSVLEGLVGAASGGATQLFGKGQEGRFFNGKWDGKLLNAGSSGKGGGNGGKGSSGGSSGNGSGGNNGNNSGANGGSTGNSGTDNGQDNSNTGSSNTPGNGTQTGTEGNGSSGLQPNSCLGDLNNQFLGGILINGDNNLNQSQQSVKIHIIVPPGEAVP